MGSIGDTKLLNSRVIEEAEKILMCLHFSVVPRVQMTTRHKMTSALGALTVSCNELIHT